MIRFLFASGAMLIAFSAAAQNFAVPPELWDRPRTGRAVLEHPVLRQAVGVWLAQPGARLVVHHGAGQDSSLAAAELRAWLAAFAVEPTRIFLRSDLQPSEALRMEVVGPPGDK